MDIPQAVVIGCGFFASSLTVIKLYSIARQSQTLQDMGTKMSDVKQLVIDLQSAIREDLHKYDIRLTRIELESGVVKDELKRWAAQE